MCALRAKLNYRGRVAPEMSGYRLFIGKWWERLFVKMLGKLNATGAIFPCFCRLYFTDFRCVFLRISKLYLSDGGGLELHPRVNIGFLLESGKGFFGMAEKTKCT